MTVLGCYYSCYYVDVVDTFVIVPLSYIDDVRLDNVGTSVVVVVDGCC